MLISFADSNYPFKTRFVGCILFIVHGDLANMQSLSERIKQTFHWNVVIPEPDKTYDLETGKTMDVKPTELQ